MSHFSFDPHYYDWDRDFRVKREPDMKFTTMHGDVWLKEMMQPQPSWHNFPGGRRVYGFVAQVKGLCDRISEVTIRPTTPPSEPEEHPRCRSVMPSETYTRTPFGMVETTSLRQGDTVHVKTPPHFSVKSKDTSRKIHEVAMRKDAFDIVMAPLKIQSEGRFLRDVMESIKIDCPKYITKYVEQAMTKEGLEILREAKARGPVDTGVLRRSLAEMNRYYDECFMRGLTKKEEPVKIRNRFYVAAPSVTTHSEQDQDNLEKNVHLATSPNDRSGKWTRKDLKAAIDHAQQMLEADPTKDHVAIVKIVKIVRRPKPKFIVEDVK